MPIKLREITNTISAEKSSARFFDSVEWQVVMDKSFCLSSKYFAIEINGIKLEINININESEFYSHFIGYGGVSVNTISSSDVEEIIHALERTVGKECKRIKFYPFVNITITEGSPFITKKTAVLDITKLSIRKKVSYEIRKARTNGIITRVIFSKEEIENFYKIYTETANRVGSEYRTPISVFNAISQIKGSFILGAFRGDSMVAGSVFLCANDWSYFWWNASNTEGRIVSANYLIMNDAIEILQKEGISFLDMASSHSSGIKRSKAIWGAEEIAFFEYSK